MGLGLGLGLDELARPFASNDALEMPCRPGEGVELGVRLGVRRGVRGGGGRGGRG